MKQQQQPTQQRNNTTTKQHKRDEPTNNNNDETTTVGACSSDGIQHAGGNRQSRIRSDASTKVEESRRCVTYSQKAYAMDGPGAGKQQTHSGLTCLSQR